MSAHLRNGALAGLAGGAALAAVLLVAGEGPLQRAIDLEPAGGGELITRTGQRAGGVVAALLVGAVLGVAFSVALALIRRPSSPATDSWLAPVGWAALAFTVLHLVPFLKYPPNPPGIGESGTVGRRTGLYLALLAWSVVAAWAGSRARRWLTRRGHTDAVARPGAVAVTAGLLLVAFAFLPAGPDPDAVPASIVWSFRLASIGGWAGFWAVTGTVLAWLNLPTALRRPRPAATVAARD